MLPICNSAKINAYSTVELFQLRPEGRDQVTKMYREMYLVGFLLRKPLD